MLKSHGVNPHGGPWDGPTAYRRRSACQTFKQQPLKRKLDETLDFFDHDDDEEDIKFTQKRPRAERKPRLKQETSAQLMLPLFPPSSFPRGSIQPHYPQLAQHNPPPMHLFSSQPPPYPGMAPWHQQIHDPRFQNGMFLPPMNLMAPQMQSLQSSTLPPLENLLDNASGDSQHTDNTFESMLNTELTEVIDPNEFVNLETAGHEYPTTSAGVKAEELTAGNSNTRDLRAPSQTQTPTSFGITDNIASDVEQVIVGDLTSAWNIDQSGMAESDGQGTIKEEEKGRSAIENAE